MGQDAGPTVPVRSHGGSAGGRARARACSPWRAGGPPGPCGSADGVHPGEVRPGLSNYLARFLDAPKRGVDLTDGEIEGTVLHFVNGEEPNQLQMGRHEPVNQHVKHKAVARALEAERPPVVCRGSEARFHRDQRVVVQGLADLGGKQQFKGTLIVLGGGGERGRDCDRLAE